MRELGTELRRQTVVFRDHERGNGEMNRIVYRSVVMEAETNLNRVLLVQKPSYTEEDVERTGLAPIHLGDASQGILDVAFDVSAKECLRMRIPRGTHFHHGLSVTKQTANA